VAACEKGFFFPLFFNPLPYSSISAFFSKVGGNTAPLSFHFLSGIPNSFSQCSPPNFFPVRGPPPSKQRPFFTSANFPLLKIGKVALPSRTLLPSYDFFASSSFLYLVQPLLLSLFYARDRVRMSLPFPFPLPRGCFRAQLTLFLSLLWILPSRTRFFFRFFLLDEKVGEDRHPFFFPSYFSAGRKKRILLSGI